MYKKDCLYNIKLLYFNEDYHINSMVSRLLCIVLLIIALFDPTSITSLIGCSIFTVIMYFEYNKFRRNINKYFGIVFVLLTILNILLFLVWLFIAYQII